MPRETRFFECLECGRQFDSWSEAEACEFDDEYEKEA